MGTSNPALSARKHELFLSYARSDNDSFVATLHGELEAANHPTWWDRIDMPARGLTFIHEIRLAIDRAQRFLIVIDPEALQSQYVRMEWQHALAASKIVIPLLRDGQPETLPPELRTLHVIDFRQQRPFREACAELLDRLRASAPPLCELWGDIPELPPHHRPRPDLMRDIADSLLIDLVEPVQRQERERILVVHGMGGSGKSVLAAALARSTSARRAFGAGIYWVDARVEESPMRILRALAGMLAGADFAELDIEAAAAQLRSALAGKRVLLVIDNLHSYEAIRYVLRAIDANTRVLVTTRHADAVAGSPRLAVGDFEADEAVQLLSDWLGPDRVVEEGRLRDLAAACGHHPLALALNGAMLRNGYEVDDLIRMLQDVGDLSFADDSSFDYEYATVYKALDVSMRFLERTQPESAALFRTFSSFFWVDGVTEQTFERLWQYRTGATAAQVRKLLITLELAAFLRLEVKGDARFVRLHDLWHDYLNMTGGRTDQVHRELVQAWSQAGSREWASGPCDEYFLRYLPAHLMAAGDRVQALTVLTGSTAWMDRLYHELESDEPYLRQIEGTLYAADQPAELARLHAARVVVGARTGGFDDEDLAAFALIGRAKEARSWARLRAAPWERTRSLLRVARALGNKAELAESIVREAERELPRILDPKERADSLGSLADAWAVLGRDDELMRLGSQQGGSTMADAVWPALSRLAADKGEFLRALEVAQRVTRAWNRWQALRVIARRDGAITSLRNRLIDAMIDAAETVAPTDDSDRRLIANTVPYVVELGDLDRAIQLAMSVSATNARAQALAFAAAGALHAADGRSTELAAEVRNAIRAWTPEDNRGGAASIAVDAYLSSRCSELAEEAALLEERADKRSELLARVAVCAVEAGSFEAAERIVADILQPPFRCAVLARSVAARVTAGASDAAEKLLGSIESADSRAYALRSLLSKLLMAGAEIASTLTRATEAAVLASTDKFGHLEERNLLRWTPDDWNFDPFPASPLAELALLLTRHGRLQEAEHLAGAIEDESERTRLTRGMAIAMAKAGVDRASLWLEGMLDPGRASRAAPLHEIQTQLIQLLAEAGEIDTAHAIAGGHPLRQLDLVRYLGNAGQLARAWELAEGIETGSARVAGMAFVAEKSTAIDETLAHRRFDAAVEAVCEIREDWSRQSAYFALTELLARCGYFSHLELLQADPRMSEDVPQTSTVKMSDLLAVAQGPARFTVALVTRWIEEGEIRHAMDETQGIDDPEVRCAAWCAIADALGRDSTEYSRMAIDQALSALKNVDESSTHLRMAVAVVEAMTRAGFRERAIQLVNDVGDAERYDVKRAAIHALVQTQGLPDTLVVLGEFEGQPDEARVLAHDAALELPAPDVDTLGDVARSLTDRLARAIALARTAASAALSQNPSARSLMDEAERNFDHRMEAQAHRRTAVEFALALATVGQLREAFETLPRQSPEECAQQLARWPQGLSLLKEVVPVLAWVRPSWREIATLLNDGSHGSAA